MMPKVFQNIHIWRLFIADFEDFQTVRLDRNQSLTGYGFFTPKRIQS
jgi:hypothetical protein